MTSTLHFTEPQTRSDVRFDADAIQVTLFDRRPDSRDLFLPLDEDQQSQLAVDAWTVGLRAIANAHAQAEEAKLKEVGAMMLNDVQRQLDHHVDAQQKAVLAVLARYFNPQDGQVTERLQQFVADGGQLAQILNQYVGPQSSVLAETLACQVGEGSALLRRLSPDDRDGIVHLIHEQVTAAVGAGNNALTTALDPLAEDSAMSRFIRSLREELKRTEADRSQQLSVLAAALDANDETSLINRLVRETGTAQRQLLDAINPDRPGSAMAIVKDSILGMLGDSLKSQQDVAKEQAGRHEAFEKEMREVLARLETSRQKDMKAPQGGTDFEDIVAGFTRGCLEGGPYIVQPVGKTPGNKRNCKTGDVLVDLLDTDGLQAGRLVIEAKHKADYTLANAIAEIAAARINRGATAGLFVMAASHAVDGFPRLRRIGRDVFVTWDERDRGSDAYLEAAMMIALSLVKLSVVAQDRGDIDALRGITTRIETQVSRLGKIEKSNDTIRGASDDIADEARKALKDLRKLVGDAKSVLTALEIGVEEASVEESRSLDLLDGSLEHGRAAIIPDGAMTAVAVEHEAVLV